MNLATLVFLLASSAITHGKLLQLSNSDKQMFLNEHNTLRAGVSPTAVGMKQMVWSNTLANDAAQHVSKCIYAHSNNKYGENLYLTTASSLSYAGVVKSWDSEKKDYNYYCNNCTAGKVCGHYTQVVWDSTTEVGCAVAFCPTVSNGWRNAHFVMCNYNPPGNVRGQRPYDIKRGCKTICKKCPDIVDTDCNCKSNANGNTAGVLKQKDIGRIVKLHKKLRKSVKPRAVDMSVLKWNAGMAKQAQTHAERCVFETSSFGYGENIHFSYGSTPDFNVTVMGWYSQGKNYNYYCDHCQPGKRCNQYKQLVQSSAKRMGCGSHICPTVQRLTGWTNVWIFVCLYDQKVIGNQRPYKLKDNSCKNICKQCSTARECSTC